METKKQVIVFQGGGQYFFWKMGVIRFLVEHYDLENTQCVGASAGALASVFMVCGIDAKTALECALGLCEEFGVWERWLRFVGIWGKMVEQWLDRLLPENAADLCNERVHILVSPIFRPKQVVSTFVSKQDLIECLMVSTHIPFLMDYSPFRWFKGWWYYDGCIGNLTNRSYKVFDENTHEYHFFYPMNDEEQQYSIFQCFPTSNRVHVADFVRHGFQYAQRLHETKKPTLPPLINPQYRPDTPGPHTSSVPDGPEDCKTSIPPRGL